MTVALYPNCTMFSVRQNSRVDKNKVAGTKALADRAIQLFSFLIETKQFCITSKPVMNSCQFKM